jgi:hypothetical protein
MARRRGIVKSLETIRKEDILFSIGVVLPFFDYGCRRM